MIYRILVLLFLACTLFACTESGKDSVATKAEDQASAATQDKALTEADRTLASVASVISGYQAFSGRLPGLLSDLDSGEYMFDTAYLEELLPQGAELFIVLGEAGEDTRMWLQQQGEPRIFSRSLNLPGLEKVDAESLAQLKERWQVVARVGGVTQVKL